MKEQYKTLVSGYHYKGETFAIIKGLHDGIIRAINYKYIDDNGQLTTPLNGLQMFVSHTENTVNQIIDRINHHIDWNNYIKEHNIDIDTITTEQLKEVINAVYGVKE